MASRAELTPHQRHRAGNTAEPRCYLRDRSPCFGQLESDHVIEAAWLTYAWRTKQSAHRAGRITAHPLLDVTLDDLLADPRNAGWLCGKHNRDKCVAAIGVHEHEIPASVREFAAEYELEHLIERLTGR